MAPLATVRHGLCAVSSALFGFFYLMMLFVLALVNTGTKRSSQRAESERLSKQARKLTFDLGYYLELEGFGLESHDVLTADGHILAINRVVPPRADAPEDEEKPRYPVLLIPGLMQSSSAYCTAGPEAVGLILSRLGYDVWLGNNRGGFKARHIKHARHSARMWDWSMAELATKDVPAMVEYIRKQTGAARIAVAAHSQGTTQTFLALARADHGGVGGLGGAVSSFSALAPAVYAGPLIDRWFLRMLRVHEPAYRVMAGYHAFIGLMGETRRVIPLKPFTFAAYIVFNYMLGWNDSLWDRRYRDRNFIFAPVFVSAKLMFWWLGKGGFGARKCIFLNENTKWFDASFPALQVFACGRDDLVLPDRLINRIHNHEPDVKERLEVVSLPSYSHLDVLWAMDAGTTVAVPMARFVWEHVPDKERWRAPKLNAA